MNKFEFGIFGKLPAHGDFIERGLQSQFIRIWDDWLQRAISDSRDLLADQWLDNYLTSPIWRFSLGQGVIDSNCWIGTLVPSVDSVGRYFPLTIAAQTPVDQDPFALLINNTHAFEFIEQAALEALQDGLNADALWQNLNSTMPLLNPAPYSSAYFEAEQLLVCNHGDQQLTASGLLYGMARTCFSSASYWYASTDNISEFITSKLPEAEKFSAMLTGDWH